MTSGGRQLTCLKLVESFRDGGRVWQRVIAKLGREGEFDPGAIDRLVRSFLPSMFAPEFHGIELEHAYRSLQFLAEVGPELEARLTGVMTERLFADASLVLFDTTSTCFEGVVPKELASFGFSRDKRGDRPQASLALLTSREGLPLGHWLYPGKQSDVKSMAEASREFRARLGLGSFVLVVDHGMVSAANLEALRNERFESVIAARLRRSTVRSEDAQQRDAIVQQLSEETASGGVRDQLKNGARRYPRLTGATLEIDLTKSHEDARCDGKWVLRTTTSLSPEQVALAYRGLRRVEHAFRTLKTPLELRPLFHTSEAGIRGHVQACVLAYALVRLIEDRIDQAGLDINAREALQDLARIRRAQLYRARVTVTKSSAADEQHQRPHTAIGAAIPERHTAL